ATAADNNAQRNVAARRCSVGSRRRSREQRYDVASLSPLPAQLPLCGVDCKLCGRVVELLKKGAHMLDRIAVPQSVNSNLNSLLESSTVLFKPHRRLQPISTSAVSRAGPGPASSQGLYVVPAPSLGTFRPLSPCSQR